MFEFGQLKYIFSYNSQTLKRGNDYYHRGAVKEARLGHNFFTNGFEVNALIQGSSLYKTKIAFNQYHEYEGCSCSCAAYSERRVPCKHIAALYAFLNNSEEFKKSVNYMAADDFMDIYYKRIPSENKFDLNVQYYIEPLGYSGKSFGSISMKIGLDKLYIVRNIRSFMQQLDTLETVEFGKKFIYNPRIHKFKDEDKKIIEFFREINTVEWLTNGEKYHGGRNVYSAKSFDVNDILLIKFLKLLDGRPFGFFIKDKWVEGVTAEFDEKPFTIDINSEEENITAKINFNSDYKIFYRWDNIIYSEGKLHVMDKNDSSYMFLKVMRDRKVDIMEFRGKQKDRFISAIPRILEKENVKVSADIIKSFVKVPLKGSIYIDKYNSGISIKIEFIYGDYKMDPIHKEEVSPFIVRDYESEERIMNLIEDSGFKVNDDAVYLEDNDKIYMFFKQILSVLTQYCSIYYTDDVRNIYRGSIRSYRGYTHTRPEASMIDISFEIDDIDPKEIRELLKSIKERKKYHKLRDGSIISLEDDKIEELSEFLTEIEEDEIKNNVISLSNYRAVNVVQSLGEYRFNGIDDLERIEDMIRRIKDYNSDKIEVPENFKEVLRDYQSTGFKWMKILSDVGLCGILADDMGLGKTLQAIVLIYGNKGKPSIIVAPSSLIFNWENEVKKFAPDLTTLVVSGGRSLREEMLQSISDYDAIITSYPLLRRDIEFYKDIEFEYCIIDEAQHIKNPESINAHCVKSIRAGKRFALTGTPMENSLMELWSIFDFLMPGYLFSKNKFMEKYERPIVRDNNKRMLESLIRSISPFILRRKKKDVLTELPDKIETKLVCKLSDEQMKIYRAYLIKTRSEIEKIIKNDGFESSRMHILAALTRLRQICCHPLVFIEDYEGGSAKIDVLEEMLDELLEGQHRILLFSQFTSLLEIIKKLLDDKKIKYKYLDGSTPVYERMGLVESFNSGEGDVFLISLKAGGTGLNLSSADTVIHFDPWWNPAVEDQASDRAHRIGQRNVVQVFKLITKDTIEEKIFELQQKKKDLINAVIQEGETIISKLSEEELMELLKI